MPTQCEVSVCLSLAPAVIEVDGKEHGLACVGALIKYMEVRAMNIYTFQVHVSEGYEYTYHVHGGEGYECIFVAICE